MLSAAYDKGGSAEPPRDTLFFQSGFEEGVTIQETGASNCSGDVIGSDGSELGDWLTDIKASPVEKAVFCYGGGARERGEAACQVKICQATLPYIQ